MADDCSKCGFGGTNPYAPEYGKAYKPKNQAQNYSGFSTSNVYPGAYTREAFIRTFKQEPPSNQPSSRVVRSKKNRSDY